MAQNITTTIVDDFDRKTPAETFPFTHNGVEYTIDLGPFNAKNFTSMIEAHERKIAALVEEFEGKMSKYLDKAQPVKGKGKGKGKKAPKNYDPEAVRAWALEEGLTDKTRGRLSQDILDAYAKRNAPVEVEAPEAPETVEAPEAEVEVTETVEA